MTPGRPASASAEVASDAPGESDPERQKAPAPVGEATPERRDHRLDRRGCDEGGGDRDRAPAGSAEIERHEHGDHTEESSREHDQPERAENDRLPERDEIRARRLRIRRRRRVRSAQARSTTEIPAMAEKAARDRAHSAAAPTAGPSSAPKIAAPIAVPIISPRRSRGVPATSHARPPVHERALPSPCAKRAMPSAASRVREPEGDACDGHEHEPCDHRAARAEARSGQASGEGGDERARRVRADEEPRLALREPELVRVVR